jgi:hypothetical protein
LEENVTGQGLWNPGMGKMAVSRLKLMAFITFPDWFHELFFLTSAALPYK